MLKQERLRRICEIVEAEGQATVTDLASQFGVTEMTIRRDLQDLDAQGLVQRIHGGAMSPEPRRNAVEPPVLERIDEQADVKQHIGLAVAGMIEDGETIFLGSGTTTLAVAEALAEREGNSNLTIITNALTVVNALARTPGITVIVVGGFLRRSELSLVGHLAESALDDLHVDRVIIGMRGVDPEHGLTSDYLQELKTDQAILDMSDMVIIVADHTKFGRVATSRTAPITAATMIVTDMQTPMEIIEAIQARGVLMVRV